MKGKIGVTANLKFKNVDEINEQIEVVQKACQDFKDAIWKLNNLELEFEIDGKTPSAATDDVQ